MWHGMTGGVWWAMLRRHGFRVAPSRLWLVLSVTWVAILNSLLAFLCCTLFRKKRQQCQVDPDLLVLVGHARSGTTLLHELVVTDPRWGFADTYQCFVPSHWLLSRTWVVKWLKYLVPPSRPYDGMQLGLELPQEDEFAIMNLGAPSPYEFIAFPQESDLPWVSVDLGGQDGELRRLWLDAFEGFLRDLAVEDPRPKALKSPLHMARIGMIRERFPRARFVHIRRNPYHVVGSMMGMTRRLYETQALQKVPDHLLEGILEFYHELFGIFERERTRLEPGRFHELSYEDLVADPVGELERMYAALGLEGFDPQNPALTRRLEEMRKFRPPRRAPLSADDLDRMEPSLQDRARQWGYARPAAP